MAKRHVFTMHLKGLMAIVQGTVRYSYWYSYV